MRLLSHIKPILFILSIFPVCLHANVGGMSGSNSFTIAGGDSTNPTYKIVSASSFGPAVFQGTVSAVSNSDHNITFTTSTDDNNDTVYPFYATGSFDPDVMIPQASVTVTSSSVSGVTFSYGSMTVTDGFSSAPEIIISPSDGMGITRMSELHLKQAKTYQVLDTLLIHMMQMVQVLMVPLVQGIQLQRQTKKQLRLPKDIKLESVLVMQYLAFHLMLQELVLVTLLQKVLVCL